MNKEQQRANPDNRSDNADKLQHMIHDTLENIEESKEQLEWTTSDQKKKIKEKNERRCEAIEGFRDEIKDEYKFD